jgi:hypothetical protein
MTPGRTSRIAVSENDGPWTTETPSARVPLGRPIQSAAWTPAQDQCQEDRDARPEAGQGHGGEHHERRRQQGDPLVLWPVDAGHDRGEVEADEHDDGAGHRRRQDPVDELGTGEVDEHTHGGEHEASDEDRTGDVRRVVALVERADRRDRRHERGAGAEVARHAVLDDQQEQDRAEAGEHDGEVGVEPHHQGEHEGGAEHGDHVLGAEPDRLAPRQALHRQYRLPRCGIDHVPLEHRHVQASRFRRGVYPRSHKLVRPISHPHWRHLPKERRSH